MRYLIGFGVLLSLATGCASAGVAGWTVSSCVRPGAEFAQVVQVKLEGPGTTIHEVFPAMPCAEPMMPTMTIPQ
jgi:hypothetical protein